MPGAAVEALADVECVCVRVRVCVCVCVCVHRGLLQQPWSPGERRELYDRRRKLLFYLLRSPMLDVLLR